MKDFHLKFCSSDNVFTFDNKYSWLSPCNDIVGVLFLAAVEPLFFSVQCVSWSILLLVSILTMVGWLSAIFHHKNLIFSNQGYSMD